MRPPVAAKGWPAPSEPPLTLILSRVDRAERRVQPKALLAECGVLPGRERAEHLGGEGLVDLVEVEVLQGQLVALEQPRHRVGGRHQQALALDDVVDRGGFGVDEVRQHGQVVLLGPGLAGEQHARRTV